MPAPRVIFVGPMRAGTTWVHEYLNARGDVCLPEGVKETFFFDRNWSKGQEWYDWHFRHFDPAVHQLIVEVAPSYFHQPLVARRLLGSIGRVRVVIMFRDPIARSWSHFLHLRRYGLVRDDIQEAVRLYPEILDASRYAHYKGIWADTMGAENISVLRFIDIASSPVKAAAEIDRCLDLPVMSVTRRLPKQVNAAVMAPRSRYLALFGRTLAGTMRSHRMYSLVNAAKRIGLKRVFYGGGETALPPLSDEDHAWLKGRLGDDALANSEDLGGIAPSG